MERWTLLKRRHKTGPQYFLKNRSLTTIWLSPRAKNFDVQRLMEKLEEVGFPLRYTKGLYRINFTFLSQNYFGQYGDDTVWIDARKKHRMKTLVETFVHEVAHFLDEEHDFSNRLSQERKRKGRRIHRIAGESDDEYLARGFERFYSIDIRDRQDLRRHHPKLFKRISSIHNRYKSKR